MYKKISLVGLICSIVVIAPLSTLAAKSGTEPTGFYCEVNKVKLLALSVDDCAKAGGKVTHTVTTTVKPKEKAASKYNQEPEIQRDKDKQPESVADNSAMDRITSYFSAASRIGEPKIVHCTLSGGTQTECYNITFISVPDEHEVGPWCPRNIADGKDAGGIWPSHDRIYDVDGAFIENLASFYDDPVWQMYDQETGVVNVTESAEACAAAARPNVDPAYYNYCVECRLSFMPEKPEITYVFPINPVKSKRAGPLNQSTGVGVALDGVKLEEPAPVKDILGAHTLAPFDPCGGHINLHVGYHYHAAMGCSKEIVSQGEHAPMIGIALDGYHIYARLNKGGVEPDDLDSCRGHASDDIGYHYHVNDPGKNQMIGCFFGEYGCLLNDPDKTCNASKRGNRPEF